MSPALLLGGTTSAVKAPGTPASETTSQRPAKHPTWTAWWNWFGRMAPGRVCDVWGAADPKAPWSTRAEADGRTRSSLRATAATPIRRRTRASSFRCAHHGLSLSARRSSRYIRPREHTPPSTTDALEERRHSWALPDRIFRVPAGCLEGPSPRGAARHHPAHDRRSDSRAYRFHGAGAPRPRAVEPQPRRCPN